MLSTFDYLSLITTKNKCDFAYQDTNLTGSFEINGFIVFPTSMTIVSLFVFLGEG